MFKFSEEVQKLKTQTLVLSGVAMFIAITGALPEKVAIIGLDLSGSQSTAGWFLFIILVYFSLKYLMLSGLEVCEKYLPKWISFKIRNVRGDTLGFSIDEIEAEYEKGDFSENEEDLGTLSGEIREIKRKQEELELTYKSRYVNTHNAWIFLVDFIFPALLSIYSAVALYEFLVSGLVHTFT